ncbi:MAG TPA: MotA/TolQ/ExbB proton channel family protein [Vicinamibacterales bacterium]|nr:MotA/TolQ/ExbB proton channel family protein [Vicinamibacterales bacterium]
MSLLGALENGLFALGQVLRFPVMLLLWCCVLAALFLAGDCAVEFVARLRDRSVDLNMWIRGGPVLGADAARVASLPASLRRLLAEVESRKQTGTLAGGGLEHLVLVREEEVKRQLTAPRLLVKVGPSLGLLGTLIPMGASLASLASGNLEAMAGQMVVAFTTTIVGLATGTVAYVIATVRQQWVNQTIHDARYLAERISGELGQEA